MVYEKTYYLDRERESHEMKGILWK